ncbi:hypothetical protein P5P86_02180 [Nocardioides sp. BP30]|uniref:S53 family peptidase n=1 Tax=Nocardioides sp. BP30 TaxID=3036374 RepID=UPI002468A5EB|nr:hypothetical protein [Nocardioides sp. BP30]WGL52642.1 hypothetical protein P5P86_02180 [Nocardioides sp. BP30]
MVDHDAMGQLRRRHALLGVGALLALALAASLVVSPSLSVASAAAASANELLPLGCSQATVLPGQARCYGTVSRPATTGSGSGVRPFATVSTPVVTPGDIADLYDLPPVPDSVPVGTGPTVALVEEGDVPNLAAELATYRSDSRNRLGACTQASGCLTVLNQDGATSPLPAADPDWAWETMMDVEAVAAACPACKILVVEASSTDLDNLDDALQTAAERADYVSMSWGVNDDGMRRSDVAGFEDVFAAHADVTFVASTGDFGWQTDLPADDAVCGRGTIPATAGDTHSCTSYPASSPYVVAAGGTMPVQDAATGTLTEQVWGAAEDDGSPNSGGASSGCSGWTTMIAAQAQNANAKAACGSARGTADLSALADDFRMYHQADASDTGWYLGGGTSLAAPLLAAMYARAGNHTSPFDIYARAASDGTAFNDITSGTATRGCPASDARHLCSAGTGWDGPTGLGTPHGLASLAVLDTAVTSGDPSATSSPTATATATDSPTATPTTSAPAAPTTAPSPTSTAPTTTQPITMPIHHSGKLRVKGKARVRSRLKASYGSFDTGTTATVTWLVNGKPVGSGLRLRVKKAWLRHRIRYVVTATGAGRTPLTLTSPTVKVKR